MNGEDVGPAVAAADTGALRRGILPLLGYAVLSAAMDVYAGNRFTAVSPASLAAVSFTLVTLYFGAAELRRVAKRGRVPLAAYRGDLVAINVATTVTWLSTFYALKYLEPAIVNVTGLALGPMIMTLAGPLMRRHSRILPVEAVVSVAICALLGLLLWGSFSGHSGLGHVTAGHAAIGVFCTMICAVGTAVTIIYMKRLGEAGCQEGTVLGTRFVLMAGVSWVIASAGGHLGLGSALIPGIIIAIFGVGLPIYVLQIGIRHTEPITTSLLVALSPLLAFVMQLADSRLKFSGPTFSGVVGVVILVGIGVLVRDRQARASAGAGVWSDKRKSPPRSENMTVAIVDAYGAGRLIAAALRERSVDFIHVRSQRPDTKFTYRPEDFLIDLPYTGDIEQMARTLTDYSVQAVIAGTESGVLLADELSVALNTPGNGREQASARRDKFAMQETIRAAGVAAADGIRSTSVQDMTEWATRRGQWPVVLKPVQSAGTDNVFICHTIEEAAAAHDKIMSSADRYGMQNTVVLVQQHLAGTEHYVNSVSRNGKHRTIEVWRYCKRFVDGHSVYDYEDLLAPDEPGVSELVDYTRDVLDALGVHNAASHTEIMMTEAGPILIECGARLGGGQMPGLMDTCVGTNQVAALADSLADPAGFAAGAVQPYRLERHLRCVNLMSPGEGAMPADDGWDSVRRLPTFAGLVLYLEEGSPLTRTIDIATCPGAVYLVSGSAKDLEEDYRVLRELETSGRIYG